MVTLNTLLLVGMIAAGVAIVATVAFLLLLGSYLGVKEIKKGKEEDEGVFTIPMSSLSSMAGGGAPRTITQADIDRARAAMSQMNAAQGAGGCADGGCGSGEKEEKPALGGQYL